MGNSFGKPESMKDNYQSTINQNIGRKTRSGQGEIPNVDINNHVQKLIEKFTNSISTIKTNDLKQVRDFLNIHNTPQEAAAILKIINNVDASLYSDGDNSMPINTDRELYAKFAHLNEHNKTLVKVKNDFLNDDLIRSDKVLKEKVNGIFKPYTNLRTEAMFYRYKYIQVNVILIIIISQIRELFDTTFGAISAEFELKYLKQQALLEKFIELARVMSESKDPMSDEQRDDIYTLSTNAYNKLDDQVKDMKDKIKNLSNGAAEEIAKMLLDTNQVTIDTLQEHMRKTKVK